MRGSTGARVRGFGGGTKLAHRLGTTRHDFPSYREGSTDSDINGGRIGARTKVAARTPQNDVEVRPPNLGTQPLTPRERDVIELLANGLRISRIAEQMKISERTVELHLRNARRKLRSSTTPQAVVRALLLGEISI